MVDFIDKTEEQSGTPINRANLMAMQGFETLNITFENGLITEENPVSKYKKVTRFNDDGSITEEFTGEKTMKKTITFKDDGSISEVIS